MLKAMKGRRERAQSGAPLSPLDKQAITKLQRASERKRKSETAIEGLRNAIVASEALDSTGTESQRETPRLSPATERPPLSPDQVSLRLTPAMLATRAERILQSEIVSSIGDSSDDQSLRKISPHLNPSRAPIGARKRSVRVPSGGIVN